MSISFDPCFSFQYGQPLRSNKEEIVHVVQKVVIMAAIVGRSEFLLKPKPLNPILLNQLPNTLKAKCEQIVGSLSQEQMVAAAATLRQTSDETIKNKVYEILGREACLEIFNTLYALFFPDPDEAELLAHAVEAAIQSLE